jgi:hypothetical protein
LLHNSGKIQREQACKCRDETVNRELNLQVTEFIHEIRPNTHDGYYEWQSGDQESKKKDENVYKRTISIKEPTASKNSLDPWNNFTWIVIFTQSNGAGRALGARTIPQFLMCSSRSVPCCLAWLRYG